MAGCWDGRASEMVWVLGGRNECLGQGEARVVVDRAFRVRAEKLCRVARADFALRIVKPW